jgi:hypothetical protein
VEQGVVVQPEAAPDPPAVLEDLGPVGVLLGRHVAGLVEQRHVDERVGVALGARIAVPVPRAPEVAALLDDADVPDASLLQPGAGDEAGEPAPDEGHGDLVVPRVALDPFDVGVVEVVGEPAGDLDVLLVAVFPQALVALGAVAGDGPLAAGQLVARRAQSVTPNVARHPADTVRHSRVPRHAAGVTRGRPA